MSYGYAFQPICPVCITPDLKCCKSKCEERPTQATSCYWQCCGCAPLHRAVCQGSAYFPVKVAYGKRVLVCNQGFVAQPGYGLGGYGGGMKGCC